MQVIPFEKLSENALPIEAIALGVFDAIHLGHQKVLRQTVKLAGKRAAVLNFTQNPSAFLRGEEQKPLLDQEQKKILLEKMGFCAMISIDFSLDFSKMQGEEFIRCLLRVSSLRWLVAGADFQCGHNRATDIDKIKATLNGSSVQLSVVEIDRKRLVKVSSTLIRSLVQKGDFQKVKRLTGRSFELVLPLSHKLVQNNSVAIWQIPIKDFSQLLPNAGCYRVQSGRHFGKMIIFETVVQLIFSVKTIENRVILIHKKIGEK